MLTDTQKQAITDKLNAAVALLREVRQAANDEDFSDAVCSAVDQIEEAWSEICPEAYEQRD